MYMPWSSESLERTIQISWSLSTVYQRLQAGAQVSRQEMLQVEQELDELRSLDEVPGAIQMHQKYNALLSPYLQSYGLRSCLSSST